MVRKEVFRKVTFDENLRTWQDVDLWLQIAGRGYEMRRLPMLTYRYRYHPDQITRTKSQSDIDKAYSLILAKLKSGKYLSRITH